MVYVHIPYCRSFCTYCGFYSELCGRDDIHFADAFADVVVGEAASRSEEIKDTLSCNTLYIGGGTPSVLPPFVLKKIVNAVNSVTGVSRYSEFTVEVNPDDITSGGIAYASFLKETGVNRVSMGVQSFDDGILKWMNRRHTARQASEAYHILKECGIDNVSIDLIFGIPSLTDAMWSETIDRALSLPDGKPCHISAYQLSVEDDSVLGNLAAGGRFTEASQEQCSGQYDILCSKMRDAGYHHYEISNFALPGREAVHNSAYWKRQPYVGLGPGAHSLGFAGGVWKRSWNVPNLAEYLSGADCGYEILSENEVAEEEIMLSLRCDTGIPASLLEDRASRDLLTGMLASGYLEKSAENTNFRIPEKYFFVSDNIIAKLI